jgi:ubiquinol-cytochrome c reductase cytochrome c1 subunit
MRFAKLALSSFAIAAAVFGATAIAQQPTTQPTQQPAPGTTQQQPAAPAQPGAEQPAAPGQTAAPPTEQPVPNIAPSTPDAAPSGQPPAATVQIPQQATGGHGGEEHANDDGHTPGGHHLLEPAGGWEHEGYFGTLDQNALQRGFKVYQKNCSSCHGMKLLSFRNLGEPGGPFHDARYPNPNDNPVVKNIASQFMVTKVDPDSGAMVAMPGITSDTFPSPYANAIAAAVANGGAVPPDLSVMAKARAGGAGYIYSLLLDFKAPPPGLTVTPGQYYNATFHGDTAGQWSGDPRAKPPGGFLAMSPPLQQFDIRMQRDCVEGAAGGAACDKNTFDDGKPTTMEQQAHDVALFLAWASDPRQVARKQMGTAVLPYLLILALLVFLSYRRLWRNIEH